MNCQSDYLQQIDGTHDTEMSQVFKRSVLGSPPGLLFLCVCVFDFNGRFLGRRPVFCFECVLCFLCTLFVGSLPSFLISFFVVGPGEGAHIVLLYILFLLSTHLFWLILWF